MAHYAVGLLLSLQLAARNTITATRSMVGLHLLGLLAGVMLVAPAYNAFMNGWSRESIAWFAMVISMQAFSCVTIGSFVLWAVIGCYRLMRTELQMRSAPWVWMGFVVYSMAYAAGVAWSGDGFSARFNNLGIYDSSALALVVAYLVAMALAWTMLFIEPKDPVEFRRLSGSLREQRWQELLQTIPRWLCALPLAAVMLLLLFYTQGAGAAFCASIMAFFVRDAGIVILLNLSPSRARADAAAMLYLIVLYGLLPAIISASTNLSVEGWLFPSAIGDFAVGVLPALVQAAVVWWLVRARWRTLWASSPAR